MTWFWGGATAAPPGPLASELAGPSPPKFLGSPGAPGPPTGLRSDPVTEGSELAELRIEGVAQPVAEQVEGKHHEQDGEPREHRRPPGARHELAAFGNHGAPRG